MPSGFGSNLTQLGKKLLLIYGIIYVVELLFEHWFEIPVVSALQLYAFRHWDFHVWQLFTHPFIHSPASPFSFLISCLIFYFFAAPVENAFGSRNFLILFYISALGGALGGLTFSSIEGLNAPFLGMMPSLLSLIVVFGLLRPEATILLMFVLPIKAKYISYGTTIIAFLTLLAKANPHGAYHLGGILFGYLYFRRPPYLNIRWIYLQYSALQLKRKRARFKVIIGQNKKDDDTPTYH